MNSPQPLRASAEVEQESQEAVEEEIAPTIPVDEEENVQLEDQEIYDSTPQRMAQQQSSLMMTPAPQLAFGGRIDTPTLLEDSAASPAFNALQTTSKKISPSQFQLRPVDVVETVELPAEEEASLVMQDPPAYFA